MAQEQIQLEFVEELQQAQQLQQALQANPQNPQCSTGYSTNKYH